MLSCRYNGTAHNWFDEGVHYALCYSPAFTQNSLTLFFKGNGRWHYFNVVVHLDPTTLRFSPSTLSS